MSKPSEALSASEFCFVVTSAPMNLLHEKLLQRFLSSSDIAKLKEHIAGFLKPEWSHFHPGVMEKMGTKKAIVMPFKFDSFFMAAAFLCELRDLHIKKVSVATNTWGATA